jgi:rootletin
MCYWLAVCNDCFDSVCSVLHEKEAKELTNHIRELQQQREAALREVAELKVQLKMVEETRDTIRRDLIDANRKIRECVCSSLLVMI